MHGLKKGILSFAESDPAWPRLFQEEKTRLLRGLDRQDLTLDHIGSTAVPGLIAKPVIDMALLFRTPEELWQIATALPALGYHFRGPHTNVGHWYAVHDANQTRLFQLHIFQEGCAAYRDHIDFRDALRSDPRQLKRYAEQKLVWAEQSNWNKAVYSNCKADFVREVIAEYRSGPGDFPGPLS
ncbi:GrpB family protein [Flavilitoribacter nigricans]|uniref:GrpB family protein n=1 Tax=Flavilitoribacter nigricans (strain ATCC 23147 / DSM 23189 / NBRC 102662 / NCIMB 1420 / SS-2) TaxID=1122177 RepID=A0A2D0N1U8_FLAN2|nr:GrpB family protein [Flavilitoribacter nigricans]PHN02511.1 hypothetical protein CRP01_31535 [Flavilitoribacter nigricans DSM 23189 = NBRC 102662]